MDQTIRRRTRPSLAEATSDVTTKEGTVWVKRSAYGRETEEQLEAIQVPIFHTKPAMISVSGSVTRNLGDYNSARVEVRVEMPCYPEDSEIRRTYTYIADLLDELIPAQLGKATGDHG